MIAILFTPTWEYSPIDYTSENPLLSRHAYGPLHLEESSVWIHLKLQVMLFVLFLSDSSINCAIEPLIKTNVKECFFTTFK